MKVLFQTKIGFIGLGKLGMPCAETMAKKGFDVAGYDIVDKTSDCVSIRSSIQEVCKDRDIVFVATPTPHENGYDGSQPTSHLPVKDFSYVSLKNIISKCNKFMNDAQTLVVISTVLPGTIRRELHPLVTNTKLVYNPYLIAMGTVVSDLLNPEMIMIGTKRGLEGNTCRQRSELLESFYNTLCDNQPRVEFGTYEEIESVKTVISLLLLPSH